MSERSNVSEHAQIIVTGGTGGLLASLQEYWLHKSLLSHVRSELKRSHSRSTRLNRAVELLDDLLVPTVLHGFQVIDEPARFGEARRALYDRLAARLCGAPEDHGLGPPTQEPLTFRPVAYLRPAVEEVVVPDNLFIQLRTQCWYWLCWSGDYSDSQRAVAVTEAAGVFGRRARQIRRSIIYVAERIVARLEGLGRRAGRHLGSYIQALFAASWLSHTADDVPPMSRVVRLFRTSLVGTLTRNAPPLPGLG